MPIPARCFVTGSRGFMVRMRSTALVRPMVAGPRRFSIYTWLGGPRRNWGSGWVPAINDRRHEGRVFGTYRVGSAIHLSSSVDAGSPLPFTPIVSWLVVPQTAINQVRPVYGEELSGRGTAFLRMDAAALASFRGPWGSRWEAGVGISNVSWGDQAQRVGLVVRRRQSGPARAAVRHRATGVCVQGNPEHPAAWPDRHGTADRCGRRFARCLGRTRPPASVIKPAQAFPHHLPTGPDDAALSAVYWHGRCRRWVSICVGAARRPGSRRPLPIPSPRPPHRRNEYRTGSGRPGPKYWQQRADYRITAALDPAKNEVRGSETIHYVNHSPDALPYLWLFVEQNLCDSNSITNVLNQPPLAFLGSSFDFSCQGFSGGLTLAYVRLSSRVAPASGAGLRHEIYGTTMRVELSHPLAPGASIDDRHA